MARTGGKERREQLIAEAIRLFGQRGYDAATLDAVAEAAGVRKQSLLYYFPTKEHLFDACVDEFVSRGVDGILCAVHPEHPGDRQRLLDRCPNTVFYEDPGLPACTFISIDDPDGPDAMYVIVLDNGRSRIHGTEYAESLACLRCGASSTPAR